MCIYICVYMYMCTYRCTSTTGQMYVLVFCMININQNIFTYNINNVYIILFSRYITCVACFTHGSVINSLHIAIDHGMAACGCYACTCVHACCCPIRARTTTCQRFLHACKCVHMLASQRGLIVAMHLLRCCAHVRISLCARKRLLQ